MTIVKNGLNVDISWNLPDNNSDAIDAYEILILKSDGTTWLEDAANCDGTNDSNVITNRICSIPFTILRSTYGLPYNAQIYAKVRAHNANGYGAYSEQNLVGARIETEPIQMTAPTLVTATITLTSIEVQWSALIGDDTGGASIDSYNLQYD